jgi:peroxiredoxin
LEENGISVFFLSTDNEEKAREMADKHSVTFPILYGMDGPAVSSAWGSYYEERRNILHATGFILRPDHVIASATYSTGPVGRLTTEDVIRIVSFYQKQAAGK